MSTFRKIQKATHRDHKERAQPEERKKLGLLEKKKDYKKRAKNWQKNKNALVKLLQKAEDRNPDEFYFGMKNSKVVDGLHEDFVRLPDYTDDKAKTILRTDISYLRYKISCDKRKIERLQRSSQLLGSGGHHTFFVEDRREQRRFDLAKRLNTLPELVDRTYNRPTVEQLENRAALVDQAPSTELNEEELTRAFRHKRRHLAELAERMQRVEAMETELKKHEDRLRLVENRKFKRQANVWRRKK